MEQQEKKFLTYDGTLLMLSADSLAALYVMEDIHMCNMLSFLFKETYLSTGIILGIMIDMALGQEES